MAKEDGESPQNRGGEGGVAMRRAPANTGVDPDEESTTDTATTLDDQLDSMAEGLGAETEEGGREEPAPEGEPAPEPEEAPEGEGEAPDEDAGEEPERRTRYRDPESGQFITAEEARRRDLDPNDLLTQEEAAEEFFSGGEEEAEGEEEQPEGPEPLEVELSEDEALELSFEDEETRAAVEEKLAKAEQVESLEERRAEVEEMHQEATAARQAAEEFEEELAEDPIGFVTRHMEDRVDEVVVDLLYHDEALEAVKEKFQEWRQDPRKREVEAERRKRERLEEQQQRKEQKALRQAAAEKGQEIANYLTGLAGQIEDPELKQNFLKRAERDLRHEIGRRAQQEQIHPREFGMDDVHETIGDLYDLYGLSPEAVNGTGEEPAGSDVTRAEPRGERAEELAEDAERYRETGKRLREGYARKKDAASSTPAGAGAPAGGPPIDSDATLDEALETLEKRT